MVFFFRTFQKPKMVNQLTTLSTLNYDNLVFSKPEINQIPGQKLTYQRIRLNVQTENGLSDLIIPSPPNLLCWGLQESRDMATQSLQGYQLPIVLWSRDGPTPDELEFTNGFKDLCEHIKKYLVEHRDDFGKYDLDLSDLKKFNPLYWKMEKGKIVEDKGPTLYAKCLYDKKKEKINTIFVNEENNLQVNPVSLLGQRTNLQFALKIEGVFIGTKISFQLKLYEVKYKLIETGMKSLLCPTSRSDVGNVGIVLENNSDDDLEEVEEEEVEEEEVEEEEVEEEVVEEVVEVVKPPPKKAATRKKKTSKTVV